MPGHGIFCLAEILTLSARPALRRELKRHVGEWGSVSHADLPEDMVQVALGRRSAPSALRVQLDGQTPWRGRYFGLLRAELRLASAL